MDYLFIDIGTYSIKFLKMKIDRGKIVPTAVKTVLISESPSEKRDLQEVQMGIVRDYLESGFDGKIIYQLPNESITSRFLELPVINKKKVEMMIPFQLDDQLPYSISKAHYASSLKKCPDHFKASISIAKEDEFEQFYNKLTDFQTLPNVLVTELAVINNFVASSKLNFPYAILDLGHSTTKAYFVRGGVVTSNHVSYIGGKIIDSFISNTYDIPLHKAVLYKHKNCFLLTENQFQKVDGPQKEFAYLLKQVIWPLIKEIKRWELGYRTKFGQKIEKYFLIGGTSNIKNITSFLSQALMSKVGHLSISENYRHFPSQIKNDEASYSFVTMMTSMEKAKVLPFNMLHGKFSTASMNDLPLHSAAFITTRSVFVSIILALFLIIERVFFLSGEIQKIDREVISGLRTPALKITAPQRSSYRRNPKRILDILREKNKGLKDWPQRLEESNQTSAVSSLALLSQVIGDHQDIELINFKSDTKKAQAVFECKDESVLGGLKKTVERSPLKDLKISDSELKLTIDFSV